jgi:hypothetical protein
MASLTGSTIATSYEQLLSLPDGGGNTSSLVAVTDGDGGTTFCISLTDASTGKAVLAVDGSHASGTEIQIDNSATDGDAFLSFQLSGTPLFTMGVDDGDSDKFKIGTTAIGTGTMFALDTTSRISLSNNDGGGQYNTVFGSGVAANWHSGQEHNTFIGHDVAATGTMTAVADKNTAVGAWVLNDLTIGSGNTAVGTDAMVLNTEGVDNVAVGKEALDANLVGDINVAIGTSALGAYVGNAAVAVGREALRDLNHADAIGTVGVGQGAGASITSGAGNTAVGYQSVDALTVGNQNTSVGYQALSAEVEGTRNTAIGYAALTAQNAGGSDGSASNTANTAVGYNAGLGTTTGIDNTYIGTYSANAMTTALGNTAIGKSAFGGQSGQALQYCVAIGVSALGGGSITTGANGTVAIGLNSLAALTSGAGNTAVGYRAADSVGTGANNTIVGYDSLIEADTAANNNTTLGKGALQNASSDTNMGNIAIGSASLTGGSGDLTGNIAIGYTALDDTGSYAQTGTIAIGHQALTALTTGADNVAIGYQALQGHTTGGANVAIGKGALSGTAGDANDAPDSSHNIAIGLDALGGDWNDASASNYNIAIGGTSQDGVLNGACCNVSMGFDSLGAVTGGDNNVSIGHNSGNTITTGSNNTLIGDAADVSSLGVQNQTVIGSGATSPAGNNIVTLGNADVTDVYMGSDSGAKVRCAVIVASQTADTYAAEIYGTAAASGVTFINKASSGTYIVWGTGGVVKGSISESGGTVSYGAFTAHHDAELPESDNDDGYPYGTLLETIEIVYTQEDGVDSERGIVYKVQKSSSAYAKNVLGSYSDKYPTPDYPNLHRIYVLGDGHILCNGEKGNISVGDGICTSSTDGEGMKADKMTMIIGIAQEDVSFSGDESKLVVVQYGLRQFTPWT